MSSQLLKSTAPCDAGRAMTGGFGCTGRHAALSRAASGVRTIAILGKAVLSSICPRNIGRVGEKD